MSVPISSSVFWKALKNKGYNFFSGVPCTILSGVLDYAMNDPEITYIPAVRENAALGMASGAYLAGRRSGILIQNSGLGNIINALTSFNLIYRVPLLIFITWRGFEGKDAPEHLIMGEKTTGILKEVGIPFVILSEKCYQKEISSAVKITEDKSIPAAVMIKKGVLI